MKPHTQTPAGHAPGTAPRPRHRLQAAITAGVVVLAGCSSSKAAPVATTTPRPAVTPAAPAPTPAATTVAASTAPAATVAASVAPVTTASAAPSALTVGDMTVGPAEQGTSTSTLSSVELTTAFVVSNDVTNDAPLLIGLNFSVPDSVTDDLEAVPPPEVFCEKPADIQAGIDSGHSLGYVGFGSGPHDSQRMAKPTFAHFAAARSACIHPYVALIDTSTKFVKGWQLTQP